MRFKPDATVFDTVNFNFDAVSKRLKELAFLNKGLEINLVDERVPEDKKPIVVNYKFDGGLHDFAMYLNEGKTPLYHDPIGYKTEKDGILIEFAMQHTTRIYREPVFLRQQHSRRPRAASTKRASARG